MKLRLALKSNIQSHIRLPDGHVKVEVRGQWRAGIIDLIGADGYQTARVKRVSDAEDHLHEMGPLPPVAEAPVERPDDIVERIAIPGFDPVGDVYVERERSGSFWLLFEQMPPTWVPESEYAHFGRCANIDKEIELAIGAPVLWDDRERFFIEHPTDECVERIRDFLIDFHARRDPKIGIHFGLAFFDPELEKTAFAYCMGYNVSGAGFHSSLQSDESRTQALCQEFGGHRCLGRAAHDQNAASQFAALGAMAVRTLGDRAVSLLPLTMRDRPYVLIPFDNARKPAIRASLCYLISCPVLLSELLAVAPAIGVEIQSGDSGDERALAINKRSGDDALMELQSIWLTLYEAARFSQVHKTACVLA